MTSADIESVAATWVARRDKGIDNSESAHFAVWLTADPRHRAAYLRLAVAWERSARLRALRPAAGRTDPNLLALRRPPGTDRRWRWSFAVAASLAVTATLVTGWHFGPGATQTYRTEVGGLTRILLADGSAVTLNTATELHVRLTSSRREVELIRGEAQFAVAHDKTRPFEVRAGGRTVRAVGTAFDVRLTPGSSLEVIVTEGRVALLEKAGSAMEATTSVISAGEAALAERDKVIVRRVTPVESAHRLAWRSGELSFQGETLAQAVVEFNRYNRRQLKIENPAIAALQVGGNFQTLDVDSFVAALERSFGITAKVREDGTLVLIVAPVGAHD